MKSLQPSFLFRFLAHVFGLFGALFLSQSLLGAIVPPPSSSVVTYNPNTTQSAQGFQPFAYRYDLSVTSPASLPVGTVQITMSASVLSAPSGSSTATALGYLQFLTPGSEVPKQVLTFTGPNQTQTVSVSLNIPFGSATGGFAYQINSLGWPTGITDNGTRINADVAAPTGLQAPAVAIVTPIDGTAYTYTVGGPALPIDITLSGDATQTAPVLTLIGSLSATDFDGEEILPPTPLVLVWTGLGTPRALGNSTVSVSTPGIYTIKATATNFIGSRETTSTFIVESFVPPPTVEITEPPEASYDYYLGSPALNIPYVFEGHSFEGGIRTLTAKLNGTPVEFVADDIGTLLASGTGSFDLSTGGNYVLEVTATDDHGTATDSTTFTINVIRPNPAIVINDPLNGTILTHTTGTPNLNVPFTFTTTTNQGFVISSVRATLDGVSLPITATQGLGTVTAVASGVMSGVAPGTHTLTAYGTCSGIEVVASVTFTIREISPPVGTPPTVVINTPALNSVYVLSSGGCGSSSSSLTIPLTFTGTSTTTGAVITQLTAKLNGSSRTVSSSTLNQKVANGSSNLVVTATGTYTITVTATDAYGTATTTRTFTVVGSNVKTALSGTVFFDVNRNGLMDTDDYGLSSIKVSLLDAADRTVATTTTSTNGTYKFTVSPGSYFVLVSSVTGMSLTTMNDHPISLGTTAITAPHTGYGLNFAAIKTMCANGLTIGYWKNNLDKAIACRSNGAQVSASTMKSYTSAIGSLALDPFACISMSTASATMGSTSSDPAALLAKQLIASEYNYANGAYIGGNRTLTYAFIYYAESVLKRKTSYTSAYLIFVKDWCDAYNNSRGGKVLGPLP